MNTNIYIHLIKLQALHGLLFSLHLRFSHMYILSYISYFLPNTSVTAYNTSVTYYDSNLKHQLHIESSYMDMNLIYQRVIYHRH